MIERVEVDERSLVRLVAALEAEADGELLRRDLVTRLEAAARPALLAAQGSILSMRSKGHPGPVLRQKVADQTRLHVRLGGRHPGVEIRAHKSGMPRGFHNAPKRLNSRGWRHQVFGTDTWVTQVGKPGWFDRSVRRHRARAVRAAKQAMDGIAERISTKARG